MSDKYVWFNNIKFTRDDKTGYYLNSTIHKRLHRYVWEYYNGEIPKGYEIHHIDMDRDNNDISNLQLLSRSEHRKIHADLLTDEQREWRRNNMNIVARPKAREWHKSVSGKEWHRQHYEKNKDNLHKKYDLVCIMCGKSFIGEYGGKFCSNACKSAYRRSCGADLVDAVCIVCGNEFKTNKYRKSKTCSRSCANKYMWGMRNESKESN